MLNLNYFLTYINFEDNSVTRQLDKSNTISEIQLFDFQINTSNCLIAEHFEYTTGEITYLDCSVYEYVLEKQLDSITKEVYKELGIIHKDKLLVKYQLKDLYSNGAFYREIAEIILVEDIDLSEKISIYPNPFSEKFSLTSKDVSLLENITILDATGKNVTNSFQIIITAENEINIEAKRNLKKGFYFILITTDEYVLSKKVIKS